MREGRFFIFIVLSQHKMMCQVFPFFAIICVWIKNGLPIRNITILHHYYLYRYYDFNKELDSKFASPIRSNSNNNCENS